MGYKLLAPAVAVGALFLAGCVSSGTYQLKEQESQQLSRSLEEARANQGALEKKVAGLEGEKAELEASLKKQKGELADTGAKGDKLAADLAEAKGEVEKLTRLNAEQAEKLKKLAVEFVEVKGEKEKLFLANQGLSVEVTRLTAENAELTGVNDKLAAAVRPENLVKTVGEQFATLQGTIDALGVENANLKQTLMDMRKGTKLPPPTQGAPAAREEKPALPPLPAAPAAPAQPKQDEGLTTVPIPAEEPVAAPPVEEK